MRLIHAAGIMAAAMLLSLNRRRALRREGVFRERSNPLHHQSEILLKH